ncbi:MAG: alkylphosphonate utilization protein [Candidatus Pacebacteria bacterium]|nr:alkylphosphonate utilization protein [Candidatus Paceibacterota bacterium]
MMDEDEIEDELIVRDSNGNILAEGDTVFIIKDIKVKGGGVLKQGTKIKNIRLTDGAEGVLGNTDTMKGLSIKAEYVKKG